MTEEEKLKKIKDASDDRDKIENILKDFKSQAANNIVNKVTHNLDYLEEIAKSRIKHKIPIGNTPFCNLPVPQRREFLVMLKDALESYIINLPLKD